MFAARVLVMGGNFQEWSAEIKFKGDTCELFFDVSTATHGESARVVRPDGTLSRTVYLKEQKNSLH